MCLLICSKCHHTFCGWLLLIIKKLLAIHIKYCCTFFESHVVVTEFEKLWKGGSTFVGSKTLREQLNTDQVTFFWTSVPHPFTTYLLDQDTNCWSCDQTAYTEQFLPNIKYLFEHFLLYELNFLDKNSKSYFTFEITWGTVHKVPH